MKNSAQRFWRFRPLLWLVLALLAVSARGQLTFVTNNGAITITGTPSVSGTLVIPSSTNGFPVMSIGSLAFQYGGMQNLIIPGSVTNIGDFAFYNCLSLTNTTLGNGVQTIGKYAFNNCGALKAVTLPDSVTSLGWSAFSSCTNLTNVVLSGGLATIPAQAFRYCTALKHVTIPNGAAFIDQEAFENTALSSVSIPDTVTNIVSYAFDSSTSLSNVVVGRGVVQVGVKAFDNYHGNPVNILFKGSPPAIVPSGTGYHLAGNEKIYFLPAATGWGTNFDGAPTTLWNPQALTGDGQFGIRSNRFNFTITGSSNIPVMIEASTNLLGGDWMLLQSLSLTNGSYYFSDLIPGTNGLPERFYRLRFP